MAKQVKKIVKLNKSKNLSELGKIDKTKKKLSKLVANKIEIKKYARTKDLIFRAVDISVQILNLRKHTLIELYGLESYLFMEFDGKRTTKEVIRDCMTDLNLRHEEAYLFLLNLVLRLQAKGLIQSGVTNNEKNFNFVFAKGQLKKLVKENSDLNSLIKKPLEDQLQVWAGSAVGSSAASTSTSSCTCCTSCAAVSTGC